MSVILQVTPYLSGHTHARARINRQAYGHTESKGEALKALYNQSWARVQRCISPWCSMQSSFRLSTFVLNATCSLKSASCHHHKHIIVSSTTCRSGFERASSPGKMSGDIKKVMHCVYTVPQNPLTRRIDPQPIA